MGKMSRDVGNITSVETIDRAGDGYQVDLVELRDGSLLEVTCEQIRCWWSREEHSADRRPAHTMRIFPEPPSGEPSTDEAEASKKEAERQVLDALRRFEAFGSQDELDMLILRHAVNRIRIPALPRGKR